MVAFRMLAVGVLVFALSSVASATSILYQTTSLGGTSWRNDYTLANDTSSVEIDEFSIYFEVGLYANLSAGSGPVDWDILALQPDLGLPADGLFDGLAVGAPLGIGQTLSGFSIVFDFLGSGTPGPQRFEFLDSSTLAVIDSGFTQVPEPRALMLCSLGLVLLGVSSRRSRRPHLGAPHH